MSGSFAFGNSIPAGAEEFGSSLSDDDPIYQEIDPIYDPITTIEQLKKTKLDINDRFGLADIRFKIANGMYSENLTRDIEIVGDLLRVVRFVEFDQTFAVKVLDEDTKEYRIRIIGLSAGEKLLKSIWYTEPTAVPRHHALLYLRSGYNWFFVIHGIKFNTKEAGFVSIFNGYDFDTKTMYNPGCTGPILLYLKEQLCSNDTNAYEYLLNWLAYIAQFPGKPTQTAILLYGNQGTGKTFFLKMCAKLFSKYSVLYNGLDQFIRRFNAGIENKVFIGVDECSWLSEKQYRTLISNITSDQCTIEQKGEAQRVCDTTQNYVISTNLMIDAIDPGDHRILVLRCSGKLYQDSAYFQGLEKILIDGGYCAMLKLLLMRNVKDFCPKSCIPMTDIKLELAKASVDDITMFVIHKLDQFIVGYQCTTAWNDYLEYVGDPNSAGDEKKRTRFGVRIKDWCERIRGNSGTGANVYKAYEKVIPRLRELAATGD